MNILVEFILMTCKLRSVVLARCILVVLGAAAVSTPAGATPVSSIGNVTVFLSYSTYGGGDVGFRISNQPAGCYGYWLSPSQEGFKTSVAFLLKAHASGEQILVGANTSNIWSGSSQSWCKVEYVGTPY